MIKQVLNVCTSIHSNDCIPCMYMKKYIPEVYYEQYFHHVYKKMIKAGNTFYTKTDYDFSKLDRRSITKEEFVEIYNRETGENKIKLNLDLDYELYISVEYKGETLYAIPYKLDMSEIGYNGIPWRSLIFSIPEKTAFTEEYIKFYYVNDELISINIGTVDCLFSGAIPEYYVNKRTIGMIRHNELVYGSDIKNLTNLKNIPYYKNDTLITENKEYYYELFMKQVSKQLNVPICNYIHYHKNK